MHFDPTDTALVVTGAQIDFPSSSGVAWELVGRNVEENNTVEHLLAGAKPANCQVFVSPHYYHPHDHQ
ncbi:hypothetical protein LSI54_07255 [Nesterenkonia sp. AY15]|uniref:hypothetical protein n=1 Tax=Nesterenkonia sp. AY15 TaxID=2901139 RepID=UPI001F4CB337|nr:hypothetical protein [Nesterenkonia sp. AY15]MCH8571153.1 hypothetical protein [Nesterenkonia sp. AY15]